MPEIRAAVKLIDSMRLLRSLVGVILAPDETVVIAICGKCSKLQKYRHHNAASAHEGPSGCILWRKRRDVRGRLQRSPDIARQQ